MPQAMKSDEIRELEAILRIAFYAAIMKVGMKVFKKTHLFASNHPDYKGKRKRP